MTLSLLTGLNLSRYQFYYDFLLPGHQGQYAFAIQKMHKKYGPIVRVNPVELHIADSSYMDTLYVSSKREKWTWDLIPALGGSIFATGPSDLHRSRRSAIDPFFSTQKVEKLQPVIQALADKVIKRLKEFKETGDVINAGAMFSAYANGKCCLHAVG